MGTAHDRDKELLTTRPFLFLDRDGTLIQERDYLRDPALVELTPGAADAVRSARALGWGVAVLTNQSGVGRGFMTLDDVEAVHAEIRRQLALDGVTVDAFFVCSHAPEAGCDCRKPRTGLADQAAAVVGADLTASVMVGDKSADLLLAQSIGAVPILVRTGYGALTDAEAVGLADFVLEDLRGLSTVLGEIGKRRV